MWLNSIAQCFGYQPSNQQLYTYLIIQLLAQLLRSMLVGIISPGQIFGLGIFVVIRMGFRPFGSSQNVLGNWRRHGNVRSGRRVSVVIGHIGKLDALTFGRIPLGSSLRDDAADAGLLSGNVIRRAVRVLI